MVAAALHSVFVQQDEAALEQQWDQVITMLTETCPVAAALMEQAREDVLAFRAFPTEHWRKIWSTNPLEHHNKEIGRHSRVVGIFPKHAAITRLVGALLLDQQEEWQLDGRCLFSGLSMAKLDKTGDQLQDQPTAALAAAACELISDQFTGLEFYIPPRDATIRSKSCPQETVDLESVLLHQCLKWGLGGIPELAAIRRAAEMDL